MECVMLLHNNELSHLCLAICILKVTLVCIKIKFQALSLEFSECLLYTSKALQRPKEEYRFYWKVNETIFLFQMLD